MASPESPAGVERNPGLGLRELGEGVIGTLGAETDDPSADVALRVAFGALLAGLLVWMWLSAEPRDRRRAAWPWATGAVIFSITFLVTGGSAPRYEALLAMLLAAGVCLLAISANRRALAATLAVMLALVALKFPAADLRLSGPSWQRTVERFEEVCLVPGTNEADVPVSPAGWPTARLRCDG